MPESKPKRSMPGPVARSRANVMSVSSLVLLALFVIVILALVAADLLYIFAGRAPASEVIAKFATAKVARAVGMSLLSSLITLALVLLTSVPIGFALSRRRFPGHTIINTIVDAPIVLPPVMIGVSLLAFFGTPLGTAIKDVLRATTGLSIVSVVGIVLCQFLVSVSFSIRAAAAAFDSVDRRLENVALTLGCTQWQVFKRVTLPLARSGLLAGCIMAWARAIGVFGPLMVFVGTSERVLVVPTAIWLELTSGQIAVSLALALVMLVLACAALAVVHALDSGGRWWGR